MTSQNLTKSLLLGVVALIFVACGDNETKMSKQMDEQWEEYAKGLKQSDINASNEMEVFIDKLQILNTKIAFYSCFSFDTGNKAAEFDKCSDISLYPLFKIKADCEKSKEKLSVDELYKDKDYQKCMLDGREKLIADTKQIARYKYDSQFDKKSIKSEYLAIFASEIEDVVSSEMGAFDDNKIGKVDKEQVKIVAQKLTKKATEGALEAYVADKQNEPFDQYFGEYLRKLIESSKKPTASCIEAQCGAIPKDDLLGMAMSAAMPYAFIAAFSSRDREMEKQMEAAVISAILNHPYGKCLIKNETQCQLKFIEGYKFESATQGK